MFLIVDMCVCVLGCTDQKSPEEGTEAHGFGVRDNWGLLHMGSGN